MCGIAGFAGNDQTLITKMTESLVHRGPDGHSVWTNDHASLGHARLAILDPRPEGDQPMWNKQKTVAIVYNGEIYNYRELQKTEGLNCITQTDTEVLLELYEKYGISFVEKLQGMFAFALYDREKNIWHLARDHKGIKPLFIAYPKNKLAFASEMRALMHALPTKPELNMRSLSLYMRLQYVPGPETLCEGIQQLPPGTILTWKNGNESRATFSPKKQYSFTSKKDFYERFPTFMSESVKRHLVSDKPVGIFLSGGMDSSIVLHHMASHTSKPIKSYTVRFDATEQEGAARFNTDAELAKKTAEFYGTDHTELLLTAELYRDHYRQTARSLDQPNADSVSVAQALLSTLAKKDVDVVLSGAGGDELFGGYPRYRIARILEMTQFIPSSIRSAGGRLLGHPSDVLALHPGAELAERLLARPAEEIERIAKNDWFKKEETSTLFHTHFARLPAHDPIRSFMEFDRNLWLIDESLRLADATTMGSGLECRVPFVDEDIIGASHATPAAWHVTPRRTKALLKDTYRNILPSHLYTLEKASFYPPLAKWLRRETAILAEEMLEHSMLSTLFNMDHVRALYTAHKTSNGYHLHTLSSLIQLQCWIDEIYNAS